jgi:tRNA 2-selenouridine synthase
MFQRLFFLYFYRFKKVAIQKITIENFLQLAQTNPVFDVRSPGEYDHAHIPGAYNLPLFTDAERAVVGTAYKQQSRQTAIKIGLDYFGVKMKAIVEAVEAVVSLFPLNKEQPHKITGTQRATDNDQRGPRSILVHCWRGGMRSAGIAWLLDLYGFKVYTLAGGYKAYRKWVREQFEKQHQLTVLGGYTGSGKTLVLHQMKQAGFPIIDLEALANHKGSAFGSIGEHAQPTQEMFENLLAEALKFVRLPLVEDAIKPVNDQPSTTNDIFIEDESQRIGNLKIPDSFWKQMRASNILFLDIPFEERLNYLTAEYGKKDKEKLVNAIIRIQKRLGGLEAKNAINFLLEDNCKECFRILLKYYDKWYTKGLYNREDAAGLIKKITGNAVDAKNNADLLMNENGIAIADTDE